MPVSTGVPYELSFTEIAGLVPEGGRGKLFESIEIAECVRIEPALMRAKPRCGHGAAFSMKQERQAANYFFEAAGSGNLASQQFHLRGRSALRLSCAGSEQNRTRSRDRACDHSSRGSIARIRARRSWLGASDPNRSNNLRAVQVGMVPALLTAGNAK